MPTNDGQSLDWLLRRQDGVLSRDQALSHGLTPAAVRHRIRPGGPWQRLLPGVYLTFTGAPTRGQTETAALVYAGPGSLITGAAALRRYGLPAPDRGALTVLVPAGRPRQSRSFVQVWPTTRMPDRFALDHSVRFAAVPRALADAARAAASFREVRALVADAVQRGLCPVDWLTRELTEGPVRGSAWLRRALGEIADGIRSVAEGDLRDLIVSAGLPVPMFNARLFEGRRLIAIADAWWPEAGVAVEVDSRNWHISPQDWEDTLRRNARMGACGIVVLHFTPRQIQAEPAMVVSAIRAALSAGAKGQNPSVRALPAC